VSLPSIAPSSRNSPSETAGEAGENFQYHEHAGGAGNDRNLAFNPVLSTHHSSLKNSLMAKAAANRDEPFGLLRHVPQLHQCLTRRVKSWPSPRTRRPTTGESIAAINSP
jgi:hypothetical protein